MNQLFARLRQINETIALKDPKLADELEAVRHQEPVLSEAVGRAATLDRWAETREETPSLAVETIVLRVGRPVLTIARDEALLDFRDAESEVWRERLLRVKAGLTHAIRSVGRIELENDFHFDWVGTGWLLAPNVVVTNRHVAEVFGRNSGTGFIFRQGVGGRTIGAAIDFLEEADRPEDFTFRVIKILHIEAPNGPDIAFLQVEPQTRRELPSPIRLASVAANANQQVAVIGYPARDSRIPDQQLMLDIFGNVFDKKRLAPGQVIRVNRNELLHDCSTLGGNSGSVVLDLASGTAVGLHFAGRFLESNFAVPAVTIQQRLARIGSGPMGAVSSGVPVSFGGGGNTAPAIASVTSSAVRKEETLQSAQFTIPLHLSISVGTPQGPTANRASANRTSFPDTSFVGEEFEEFVPEAPASDYADREGYDPAFLGVEEEVPLPQLSTEQLKGDVLTFEWNGQEEKVLNYQHFSVLMSRSRRICFFSAVNIDGVSSFGLKRVGWRLDPRIPREAQIIKECYGNPPKFSRGHMTRREDPIWGSKEEGELGNADSMHVTNAVPQMQSMNGGIWLELENYALSNARKDDMRISVFTGPVLHKGDPMRFGVQIPLSFWKVIVFIHDETGRLCATGYRISQEDHLQEEEFVFGRHQTAQVSLASIEKTTGLSFGILTGLDPLAATTERPVPPVLPLTELEQIRFF